MKCTLKFDMAPGYTTYQYRAFPLGIIKANIENYSEWLANKLILPFWQKSTNSFQIYEEDILDLKHQLFETQTISVQPSLIKENYIDIVPMVEHMIQAGNYVLGNYNEGYIPRKSAYQKYDFSHDYIIFGYDDEKQVFFSAGYLESGKYEPFEISYDDYINSLYYLDYKRDESIAGYPVRVNFSFQKIVPYSDVTLDLKYIYQKLEDYLSLNLETYGHNAECIYGMAVWDKLIEYINDIQPRYLDNRASKAFMEHKQIMYWRFQTLFAHGLFNDEQLIESYKSEVFDPAGVVHRLFVKANLTGNPEITSRVSKLILEITEREKSIIRELLDNIKEHL